MAKAAWKLYSKGVEGWAGRRGERVLGLECGTLGHGWGGARLGHVDERGCVIQQTRWLLAHRYCNQLVKGFELSVSVHIFAEHNLSASLLC